MNILGGTSFMPKSGGTMTGPLIINANVEPLLTLNRPDGTPQSHITAKIGGNIAWQLAINSVEPKFMIKESLGITRLSLDTGSLQIGTAVIPFSGIGASGSAVNNGVAAGATSNIVPATGLNNNTFICLFKLQNSVSAVNDGSGFSTAPDGDTDSAAACINSDASISVTTNVTAAGSVRLTGKNTNAGVANLTWLWKAIGM